MGCGQSVATVPVENKNENKAMSPNERASMVVNTGDDVRASAASLMTFAKADETTPASGEISRGVSDVTRLNNTEPPKQTVTLTHLSLERHILEMERQVWSHRHVFGWTFSRFTFFFQAKLDRWLALQSPQDGTSARLR